LKHEVNWSLPTQNINEGTSDLARIIADQSQPEEDDAE
jgi:hypothetical protein